jgi:NADPH:quinone reductase-like Zn-dependent oxidoreductase
MNQAAWIKTAKAKPLEVGSASTPKPGLGEVIVKNAFVAINPVDWKTQEWAPAFQTYPNILGRDIAGESSRLVKELVVFGLVSV